MTKKLRVIIGCITDVVAEAIVGGVLGAILSSSDDSTPTSKLQEPGSGGSKEWSREGVLLIS